LSTSSGVVIIIFLDIYRSSGFVILAFKFVKHIIHQKA
jgi:hypothetical protein